MLIEAAGNSKLKPMQFAFLSHSIIIEKYFRPVVFFHQRIAQRNPPCAGLKI